MKEYHKKRMQLWVDALRSGEYNQGFGSLIERDDANNCSYCCLGVACKIYEKQTGIKLLKHDWAGHFQPSQVSEWFGFPSYVFEICSKTTEQEAISATIANDELKWSFKKIADAIEKTYLKEGS